MEENNNTGRGRAPMHIKCYTKSEFENIEDRSIKYSSTPSKCGGLSYGIDALDWMTYGMNPGDFIVIAGRTSMGKTDFLVNIAGNVAKPNGKTAVVFFSLKLPAQQIFTRLMSSLSDVKSDNLSMGNIEDLDWPRIVCAAGNLQDTPLFIDDSAVLSLDTLRQKIAALQAERKVGLIVIDSLQLLSDVKDENDTSQVAHLSRSIKTLARDLHVPILASAHLSKSAQSRLDKRPTIEDLEAWESVTEYADVVGFLHPEEMFREFTDEDRLYVPIIEEFDEYDGTTEYVQIGGFSPLKRITVKVEGTCRVFECIIRKNVNGIIGSVPLLYDLQYCRFSEVNIVGTEQVKQ